MKKNILFLFLVLLISVFLFSCGKDESDRTEPTVVDPTQPTPTQPTQVDEIVIIKNTESLSMMVGESREYNLDDYVTYTGTKYTFVCNTENKGVVSASVDGKKLKINALSNGSENVVVSLDNKKITFAVVVNGSVPSIKEPVFEDLNVSFSIDEQSIYEVELNPKDKGSYKSFAYSLKEANEYVTLDGNKLTISATNLIDEIIIIEVLCDGEFATEFSINVKTTSSIAYDVVNGSFDNGLDGWTVEGEFGIVHDKPTWWSEEMPMFNVGNYFSGYGIDGESYESGIGTLTSSLFTLGGNGYITFMLGGSGNENCYISVEDVDGNVIAIYRNTEFRDFPAGFILGENIEEGKSMVGNTVFLANLVKYKANLSDYIGQELKVVLHDEATSNWGLMFFDELVAYNIGEIDGYVEAINVMSDFTELKALVANAITSSGDYTESSFNAYNDKITIAKEVLGKASAKQEVVDALCLEILDAKANLKLREITLKDVPLSKIVIVNDDLILNFSDYFDTNDLSSVTFAATSEENIVVTNEGLLLDTTGMELKTFTIALSALYQNEVQKEVVITIEITNDPTPVVKEAVVEEVVDLYCLTTESYIYDLASNIENVANLELKYFVLNEEWVELESSLYEFNELKTYELSIIVVYEFDNEELNVEYTLKVTVKDTTAHQVYNGDFEKGTLEGWVVTGPMGDVTDKTNYWLNDSESMEGYEFGLDGSYMFSAYAVDQESAFGTLRSSTFVVGGSGWITFKIGAAKNTDLVNVQIVDATNGDILAAFGNTLWQDRTNDRKSGCTLIAYKANISNLLGKEVYIRVVDNAKYDYGLFFLDSFNTYYEEEPSNEFNVATELGIRGNIYEVVNGGFEEGLKGWLIYDGEEPGKVSNLDGYWRDNFLFEKDGDYLFHALEGQSFETDPSLEYRMGVLRSHVFTLKENAIISFKLGAAKNDTTGIRFVNVATGEVMASFYNTEFNKHDGNEGRLMQYAYQFANDSEVECYIEIYDNSTGDWGLVAVDSIVCNLLEKPQNSFEAVNQVK